MIIGTRILYPEEVKFWDAEIVQVSVYYGMHGSLKNMEDTVSACKKAGLPYVIHPVHFSLLKKEMHDDIMGMAELAEYALILHDERTPDGRRVEGEYESSLFHVLEKLKSRTEVSFENAVNTHDVHWFWGKYAESITLDIGHVESSGLDSLKFVRSLKDDVLKKIRFVHIHRNNGLRGGITDHWPINNHCREFKALEELINLKSDIRVILELNEIERIEENLNLLKGLRDRIKKF
jgi:sugar phosphate isomerase/epimerase